MTPVTDSIIDALSIDCLIFGFKKSELEILLVQHGEGISKGKWALPGGWIKYNEGMDESSVPYLERSNRYFQRVPRTIGSLRNVDRYPTKRVITIAYYALIKQ